MDKIYSRRKIKLFYIFRKSDNYSFKHEKIKSKIMVIISIFSIAILTAYIIINAINPIIDKNCSNIAKTIATNVSNEQTAKVMAKYKYEDLCNILKDNNGNIVMVSSNVISINEIISKITIGIQNKLNDISDSSFKMKLGSVTGIKFISGIGPDINIKMSTVGNIDTNLKSEFISSGINQTIHKIYLETKCNVSILTPFNTKEEVITNQILLAEAIIVGTTPETYYNFNGGDTKDLALETMQ